MIVANHICKKIKGKEVLNDISFVVHPGDIIGLIGVAGSGKSTLLKLIAGILEIDDGYLRVDKVEPTSFRHLNQNQVGMICQNLFNVANDSITIKENFKSVQKVYQISKQYYIDVMKNAKEQLNMESIFEKTPSQLSQGERSKVEIIYMLLVRPRIWLLDQPTLGIDYESRVKIYHLIKYFKNYENMQAITILLETNNLQELEMLCSRVLVLKNTKLAFKGELDILKKKYMSYGIVKFNIVSGEIILEDMPFVEYEIDGSYVKIVYEKKWIDAIAVLKHIQKKAVVEHVSISDVDIETIISNIVR